METLLCYYFPIQFWIFLAFVLAHSVLWLQLLPLYDLHLLLSTTFPKGPVLTSQKRWITQKCLEEHTIWCVIKSVMQHPWLSSFTWKSRAVLPKVQSTDQCQSTNFITSPRQGVEERINIETFSTMQWGFFISIILTKWLNLVFLCIFGQKLKILKNNTHTHNKTGPQQTLFKKHWWFQYKIEN